MRKSLLLLLIAAALLPACKKGDAQLRLLYWNIQNGMWDGQTDNYDRFVDFVKSKDPDICVWCEAQTIFETNSEERMPDEKRNLPDDWGKIAERYGHSYWGIGGYRDSYPQVITSRFPITYIDKITGDPDDVIVSHGAGWATVEVAGKTINIVTLHTWPMAYEFKAEDKEASRAACGGDLYRAREIKYICEHTVGTEENAGEQYWMMMGDYNSISVVDNDEYKLPVDTAKFLVHDYIRKNTPYIDVIREKYGTFVPTTGEKTKRIDYVYLTGPLYDRVCDAQVIWDDYTTPVRDPEELGNFWHPSDHLPIMVDFDLSK